MASLAPTPPAVHGTEAGGDRWLIGGDERQALALGIGEVERGPPPHIGATASCRTLSSVSRSSHQASAPPGTRSPMREMSLTPGMVRRGPGPVEEGHVGAGRALRIGVEEVIGGYVVLVHRLLHQPEAQHVAVEMQVGGRVAGDGGNVVQAEESMGVMGSPVRDR